MSITKKQETNKIQLLNSKSKKKLFLNLFLLICLFLVSWLLFIVYSNILKQEKINVNLPFVKINNTIIPVEIVDTKPKQIQGLSDRKELEKNSGMLFIFQSKEIRRFWMKNMHFPLDIIWINDNKIVNISKDLPPKGETPDNTYSSETEVNYVLEVNAGFCNDKGIEIGNDIEFNF